MMAKAFFLTDSSPLGSYSSQTYREKQLQRLTNSHISTLHVFSN